MVVALLEVSQAAGQAVAARADKTHLGAGRDEAAESAGQGGEASSEAEAVRTAAQPQARAASRPSLGSASRRHNRPEKWQLQAATQLRAFASASTQAGGWAVATAGHPGGLARHRVAACLAPSPVVAPTNNSSASRTTCGTLIVSSAARPPRCPGARHSGACFRPIQPLLRRPAAGGAQPASNAQLNAASCAASIWSLAPTS
jgi:hypothetical protein